MFKMIEGWIGAQSAHNSVTRFCDNKPDIEGEILDKNEKNSSRTADKRESLF